jgi:nitrite reductase/ring-hydroxylating ferredoxin subunit
MAWTKVISADELAPGARQVVKVEEQSLLVLNEAGKIYAINSICPHLKLPLKKGKITAEGSIVCPWHRSAFDLETGNVKSWCPWPPVVGNLLGKVSQEKTLAVFPTRVENGQIMVDLSV